MGNYQISFKFAIEPSLEYTVQSISPKLEIYHEPTNRLIAVVNYKDSKSLSVVKPVEKIMSSIRNLRDISSESWAPHGMVISSLNADQNALFVSILPQTLTINLDKEFKYKLNLQSSYTLKVHFPLQNFDYLGTDRSSKFPNFNTRRQDNILIYQVEITKGNEKLFPIVIDNMQIKNFNQRDSLKDVPLDIYFELIETTSQGEQPPIKKYQYFMVNCQAINKIDENILKADFVFQNNEANNMKNTLLKETEMINHELFRVQLTISSNQKDYQELRFFIFSINPFVNENELQCFTQSENSTLPQNNPIKCTFKDFSQNSLYEGQYYQQGISLQKKYFPYPYLMPYIEIKQLKSGISGSQDIIIPLKSDKSLINSVHIAFVSTYNSEMRQLEYGFINSKIKFYSQNNSSNLQILPDLEESKYYLMRRFEDKPKIIGTVQDVIINIDSPIVNTYLKEQKSQTLKTTSSFYNALVFCNKYSLSQTKMYYIESLTQNQKNCLKYSLSTGLYEQFCFYCWIEDHSKIQNQTFIIEKLIIPCGQEMQENNEIFIGSSYNFKGQKFIRASFKNVGEKNKLSLGLNISFASLQSHSDIYSNWVNNPFIFDFTVNNCIPKNSSIVLSSYNMKKVKGLEDSTCFITNKDTNEKFTCTTIPDNTDFCQYNFFLIIQTSQTQHLYPGNYSVTTSYLQIQSITGIQQFKLIKLNIIYSWPQGILQTKELQNQLRWNINQKNINNQLIKSFKHQLYGNHHCFKLQLELKGVLFYNWFEYIVQFMGGRFENQNYSCLLMNYDGTKVENVMYYCEKGDKQVKFQIFNNENLSQKDSFQYTLKLCGFQIQYDLENVLKRQIKATFTIQSPNQQFSLQSSGVQLTIYSHDSNQQGLLKKYYFTPMSQSKMVFNLKTLKHQIHKLSVLWFQFPLYYSPKLGESFTCYINLKETNCELARDYEIKLSGPIHQIENNRVFTIEIYGIISPSKDFILKEEAIFAQLSNEQNKDDIFTRWKIQDQLLSSADLENIYYLEVDDISLFKTTKYQQINSNSSNYKVNNQIEAGLNITIQTPSSKCSFTQLMISFPYELFGSIFKENKHQICQQSSTKLQCSQKSNYIMVKFDLPLFIGQTKNIQFNKLKVPLSNESFILNLKLFKDEDADGNSTRQKCAAYSVEQLYRFPALRGNESSIWSLGDSSDSNEPNSSQNNVTNTGGGYDNLTKSLILMYSNGTKISFNQGIELKRGIYSELLCLKDSQKGVFTNTFYIYVSIIQEYQNGIRIKPHTPLSKIGDEKLCFRLAIPIEQENLDIFIQLQIHPIDSVTLKDSTNSNILEHKLPMLKVTPSNFKQIVHLQKQLICKRNSTTLISKIDFSDFLPLNGVFLNFSTEDIQTRCYNNSKILHFTSDEYVQTFQFRCCDKNPLMKNAFLEEVIEVTISGKDAESYVLQEHQIRLIIDPEQPERGRYSEIQLKGDIVSVFGLTQLSITWDNIQQEGIVYYELTFQNEIAANKLSFIKQRIQFDCFKKSPFENHYGLKTSCGQKQDPISCLLKFQTFPNMKYELNIWYVGLNDILTKTFNFDTIALNNNHDLYRIRLKFKKIELANFLQRNESSHIDIFNIRMSTYKNQFFNFNEEEMRYILCTLTNLLGLQSNRIYDQNEKTCSQHDLISIKRSQLSFLKIIKTESKLISTKEPSEFQEMTFYLIPDYYKQFDQTTQIIKSKLEDSKNFKNDQWNRLKLPTLSKHEDNSTFFDIKFTKLEWPDDIRINILKQEINRTQIKIQIQVNTPCVIYAVKIIQYKNSNESYQFSQEFLKDKYKIKRYLPEKGEYTVSFDKLQPEKIYKFYFIARSEFGLYDLTMWSQVKNITLQTLKGSIDQIYCLIISLIFMILMYIY